MWSHLDTEAMTVSEYTGYSVEDIIEHLGLGYVQLNQHRSTSCIIKILEISENSLVEIDSILIREEGNTWTLPTVWELYAMTPVWSAVAGQI